MLLAGGAGVFLYARYQLQQLAANHVARVRGHSAIEQAVRYDRLSRAGLWLAGAGLLAALSFALLRAGRARVRDRRAPHTISAS